MMARIVLTMLLLASEALAFSPIVPSITRRGASSELKVASLDTSAALNSIDSFYQNEPYIAAFLTCSVKASAADWITQFKTSAADFLEKQNKADFRRNAAFWLYGGIYQGMAQEYLYGTLFPTWFAQDQVTLASVTLQVAIDIGIITPLVCLPVAYLFKASVAKDETLWDGLVKYKDHVLSEGLLWKYSALWVPVQFLTFGVIPHHLRIVFIALVSFFWLMILSNISATQTTTTSETTT